MNTHNLAYMANQIGTFYASYPREQAIESIANHIQKFWDPRMRKAMLARIDSAEGEPLQEIVRAAFERLSQGGKTSAALSE